MKYFQQQRTPLQDSVRVPQYEAGSDLVESSSRHDSKSRQKEREDLPGFFADSLNEKRREWLVLLAMEMYPIKIDSMIQLRDTAAKLVYKAAK